MRNIPVRFQLALAVLLAGSAIAAQAAVPAQAGCAPLKLNGKDAKFTGQISSPPNGSLFEVSSGNESVLVRYSNAVSVCEGGQAASANALTEGASVVVYGPEKKKGKEAEIDAVEIVVAGNPPSGMRGNPAMAGDNFSRGSASSFNSNSSSDPSGGTMASSGQTSGRGDDIYNQGGKGNVKSSGGLSCEALLFGVKAGNDPSGKMTGRASVSDITCVRPADQMAMQLAQDAITRRRLSSVTLNWQNQIEAILTNAEIASVQFATDNGNQIVEISYSCQKGEITHVASGTKIAF